MAEVNDPKSLEKLKELETSIARELDQKIVLSEPTDPRLDGSVQLNPNLVTEVPVAVSATASVIAPTISSASPTDAEKVKNAGPINSNRNVDDISLEEVDELLKDADSSFSARMEEIKSEVAQVQMSTPLESISISADYLQEAEGKEDLGTVTAATAAPEEREEETSLPERKESLLLIFNSLLWQLLLLPYEVVVTFLKQGFLLRKFPFRQVLSGTLLILSSLLKSRIEILEKALTLFKSFSKVQLLKMGLLIVLVTFLIFVSRDLLKHSKQKNDTDPFLKSFDEVANSINEMNESSIKDQGKLPIPEFVVTLPRLIANLKSESPRYQPMVALELYFETSQREAAIEIQKRETEVRDIVARVLEQSTFQQVEDAEGKEKLRQRIKMALNRFLNNGRVQGVFFKSIQIHQ